MTINPWVCLWFLSYLASYCRIVSPVVMLHIKCSCLIMLFLVLFWKSYVVSVASLLCSHFPLIVSGCFPSLHVKCWCRPLSCARSSCALPMRSSSLPFMSFLTPLRFLSFPCFSFLFHVILLFVHFFLVYSVAAVVSDFLFIPFPQHQVIFCLFALLTFFPCS